MFGRGLVRTVDDFGRAGETPSHPELLDHLARRLIDSGWSIKSLIREIARSRTWQLASTYNERNYEIDPDNVLLWRAHKRRLEAEAIRDAMLAVSGQLELNRRLGTLLRDVGEGGVGLNVFEPVIRVNDSPHRSVYLPRVRAVLPEMLELFDAPDAGLVTGAREATSSPLQALFLMNSEFVQQQADVMARRLLQRPPGERITYAYRLAFARTPTAGERRAAERFMADLRHAGLDTEQTLAIYCQALLCTTEFRSID